MYIRSRTFSIVYKLVLVVSGILGLLLTFCCVLCILFQTCSI
jgi:hypothetical protein